MTDTPRTKGQRTQEKILEEALKLFGKHGFAQTSMQMIADACDLSQGAVTQHFPSKARLLEAVRRIVSASNHGFIDSQISMADDAATALLKHMRLTVEWSIRYPAHANIIILTYQEAFHDSANREAASGAIRLGRERILRYVLAAQREGSIPQNLDGDFLAEAVQCYLIGMLVSAASAGVNMRGFKPYEEKIETFFRRLTGAK